MSRKDNYWIIEAIAYPLTYLEGCRYIYYPRELGGKPIEADFAMLLYKVHRCTQSHGAETPIGYELIAEEGGNEYTKFSVGEHGEVRINARIIPALAMAIVLQDIDWEKTYVKELNKYSVYCESIGQMPINEWWGRRNDFKKELERSGYYSKDTEPQAILYSLDENNRLNSIIIKRRSECIKR